jgi:LPS O-antigen subunit length determinant protein (WzzB/FepE family)
MEQDEIYLIDLWRIFGRERRWFVGVLVVVLACTYAFVHMVKPQWEATAWIQVGQVGQVPTDQDPKIVEPLMRVVERLQLVPFKNDVLKSIGFGSDSPEARLYRKSLKLEPMPYAGQLIRMTVRAPSPQLARQFANATVARLQAVHQRLEELPLQSARARLEQVQADLRDAVIDRSRLLQASGSENREDSASKSMAAVLLASKNEDIRSLQKTRNDLIDHLGPTYTYETSLPWPVYVPKQQAFPNHALMWGIGLLLGVFLAAFAATTRNAMRRAASRRAASV